jgi:hypothetical protein
MAGLPEVCVLMQAFCLTVAPQSTYKADWSVYRHGSVVRFLCIENATDEPSYFVARPRPGEPPEIELGPGLKFCGPPIS